MTLLQICFTLTIGAFALSCTRCQKTAGTIVMTTQPSSVNTTANTEVVFNCAADNANLFLWYLNGTYIKYITDVISDVETRDDLEPPLSVLTIWVPLSIGHLNKSHIHCKALDYDNAGGSNPVNSSKALLLIQGPIEPVGNLQVRPNCEASLLYISWKRPYTLKGVNIAGYNICVNSDCIVINGDIEDATLPFPAISTSFHDTYDICAQAEDSGYESLTNFSCTHVSLNEGPNRISYHQITRNLFYSYMFEVKFGVDFEGDNKCQLPQRYAVKEQFPDGTRTYNVSSLSYETPFHVNFTVHFDLQETNVSVTLLVTNSAGSNNSDPIEFALFHVQDAFLSNNDITCRFLDGSNAQGCRSTLTCENGASKLSQEKNCDILRASPTDHSASGSILCQDTPINCSSYSVYVYDIFSDGSVAVKEALVLRNINIISPTSSPVPTLSSAYLCLLLLLLSVPICIAACVITYYLYKKGFFKRKSATFTLHDSDEDQQDKKNCNEK